MVKIHGTVFGKSHSTQPTKAFRLFGLCHLPSNFNFAKQQMCTPKLVLKSPKNILHCENSNCQVHLDEEIHFNKKPVVLKANDCYLPENVHKNAYS